MPSIGSLTCTVIGLPCMQCIGLLPTLAILPEPQRLFQKNRYNEPEKSMLKEHVFLKDVGWHEKGYLIDNVLEGYRNKKHGFYNVQEVHPKQRAYLGLGLGSFNLKRSSLFTLERSRPCVRHVQWTLHVSNMECLDCHAFMSQVLHSWLLLSAARPAVVRLVVVLLGVVLWLSFLSHPVSAPKRPSISPWWLRDLLFLLRLVAKPAMKPLSTISSPVGIFHKVFLTNLRCVDLKVEVGALFSQLVSQACLPSNFSTASVTSSPGCWETRRTSPGTSSSGSSAGWSASASSSASSFSSSSSSSSTASLTRLGACWSVFSSGTNSGLSNSPWKSSA